MNVSAPALASVCSVLPTYPEFYETPAFDLVRYRVQCIAPYHGRHWSLDQLDDSENREFRERITELLLCNGVREGFIPSAGRFSGAIVPQNAFAKELHLVPGSNPESMTLHMTTASCEGLPVMRRQHVLFSTAGCALVVLTGTWHEGTICIAAHAGRDSLMDPARFGRAPEPRKHLGVIHAMVAFANERGGDPETYVLRAFHAIPWDAFPHDVRNPTHGESNRLLHAFLNDRYDGKGLRERQDGTWCLDLEELIRAQAAECGIPVVECLGPLPKNGRFAYTTHPEPHLSGAARNLVIFERR